MFYDTTIISLIHKDPDFLGFKWVLKALSTNSFLGIQNIEIQKDLIVSTDGHRLHVYYTKEKYPPGIFKPLVRQRYQLILEKVTDVQFPEWENLFPAKKEIEKELRLKLINSHGYTELVRQMEESITLDFNYFMDLDSYMTKASITKDKGGILFEDTDGSKKALIMPLRM